MYKDKNHYLWQPAGTGARLLKVFGTDSSPALPDTIQEYPLIEIGPYCFADRMPAFRENAFLDEEPVSFDEVSDRIKDHRLPPALGGRSIESVSLPDACTTLHNGAFYNCRLLCELSAGPMISGIGSDVFTNDTRLTRLVIRAGALEETGLMYFLERISDDLLVEFRTDGHISSSLFFPEYYEWLDEVTAAHIFTRSVHGEGFRMRKVFSDRKLSFERYDQCFPLALRSESPLRLVRIALNRLRYPTRLSDQAKERYKEVADRHLDVAMKHAIDIRDGRLTQFIIDSFHPDAALLDQARIQALDKEWGEGAALIIAARQALGSRSYDLEW